MMMNIKFCVHSQIMVMLKVVMIALLMEDEQVSSDTGSLDMEMVLDSGATEHMANKEEYFDNLQPIHPVDISVEQKNEKFVAKQQGNISIKTFYDGDSKTKFLYDVLYAKDLKCNLLSIRSLTKKGYQVLFDGDMAYVSKNEKTMFVAEVKGNLYRVTFHIDRNIFAGVTNDVGLNEATHRLWHYRLGHLNAIDLKRMASLDIVDGMKKLVIDDDNQLCDSCVMSKQTRLPFPKKINTRSNRVLELIHTDVSEVSEIS